MINQQLRDYISNAISQGFTTDQIKASLLSHGWPESDVTAALSELTPSPTTTPETFLPGPIPLLKEAWDIYKHRFGPFLGIAFVPMLIVIAAVIFVGAGGLVSLGLLSSKFASGGFILLIILALVFTVIMSISQAWGQTALLCAITSQEKIGVMEAYRRGWKKIFAFWIVSFLTGIITAGGLVLFLIPGVIFSVWFCFAVLVLISEDVKGMSALLKSREYVRGKSLAVCGRFLFVGALSIILNIVLVFLMSLFNLPKASDFSNFLIWLFLAPLGTVYSFVIYHHLKSIKGDFAFSPTQREKTKYILIGILGLLIIPATFILAIAMVAKTPTISTRNTTPAILSPTP